MDQSPPQPKLKWGEFWTPGQRAVVGGLVAFVLVIVAVRWWNRPQFVPDPMAAAGPRSAELRDRLDPNVASWQRLAVLPGIGEKRAKVIVAYREAFLAGHEDTLAFERPEDLQNVRGIGPATVENLRPFLVFPPKAAMNQP